MAAFDRKYVLSNLGLSSLYNPDSSKVAVCGIGSPDPCRALTAWHCGTKLPNLRHAAKARVVTFSAEADVDPSDELAQARLKPFKVEECHE